MIRSIRSTLTSWYVGVFAILLCVFGVVLYRSVKGSLIRDVDRALLASTEAAANSLRAFWEAEQRTQGLNPGNWVGSPPASLSEEIGRGNFGALVSRWAASTRFMDDPAQALRLIERSGRPLLTTAAYQAFPPPLLEVALGSSRHGALVYQVFLLPEGRVRALTRPMMEGERVVYVLQATASLSGVDTSVRRLQLWLWWLIPLTLGVTTVVGWMLAGRALQPVGAIIHQATRISAARLDERVTIPRTGDELEALARTFNHMLGRLEQAFKQMRQFSAAASHELRTPLTVMKGELEVALRRARTEEEYRALLHTQLETVDAMTRIVEELLMLARSETVEGALDRRPLELGRLVDAMSQSWRTHAGSKDVALEVAADGPAWIAGERQLISRVVANLLDNAIRHTPSHGRVVVQTGCDNGEAFLRVADTGVGIPETEIPYIFDRFFKATVSVDGLQSTGLGLGLCRWITEAHYGHIEVTSQPGNGAVFTVWFPRISQTSETA